MKNTKKTEVSKVKAKIGFISYSHKDARRCDELREHLSQLVREQLILVWYDGLIDQRIPWDSDIKRRLNEADIVLLLVSARFLASHYIWEVEITAAMKKFRKKKALVLPIIIGKCDWETACFAKINAIPTNGAPVIGNRDRRDIGWTQVAKKIRELVQKR